MAGYYQSGGSPFRRRPGPQNRGLLGDSGARLRVPRQPAQPPIQPPGWINGAPPYQYGPTAPDDPYANSPRPDSGGPPRPDLSGIDFSNDPILARVRALGQQNVASAEADALAQQQQLVIGYGDPGLAKKLGLGGTYAKTAENNPFSTVKELARTYDRRNVFDINRPLSDYRNLFYSTERGRQLAASGEQNLRDQATAERAVQDRLAQIQRAVVQARMQAQADQLQAEQEAYARAVQQALYGSYQ